MSGEVDDHQGIVESLAEHRALGDAPAAEHRWLADSGTLQWFELGEVVTRQGQLAQAMLVILTGHLVIRVDRGAGAHKIIEWRGGDVGGTLPYSRGSVPPSDVVAEERTRVLAIDKESLPELARECPVITTKLVHLMLDRARQFNASDLRDEKLLSLGKLSAGLAHEINNPAAAAVRSASLLQESIEEAARTTRALCSLRLDSAQMDALTSVRDVCISRPAVRTRSSVEQAEHEDALAAWLSGHGLDDVHADALAETPATLGDLETLAALLDGEALEAGMGWLAADCAMRSLATDIESAAKRIRDLVNRIKSFTYMDRALTTEPVDLAKGIKDTLALLEAKRREKAIKVWADLPDDLPRVEAVGGELNQVWMNLLENAFDAVGEGGNVVISAAPEGRKVSVKIIDDGPGVPQEIRGRIFEPFFTTKGVGKGTGLGLDVVTRVLKRHEGDIELDSRPGMTEFLVRLPVKEGV